MFPYSHLFGSGVGLVVTGGWSESTDTAKANQSIQMHPETNTPIVWDLSFSYGAFRCAFTPPNVIMQVQ